MRAPDGNPLAKRPIPRSLVLLLLLLAALQCTALCQQTNSSQSDEELRAVVVLARHGVRAPIASEIRGSVFNAQPWPAWPSAPGVLTEHGAKALQNLGAFYRVRYASLLQDVCRTHTGVYAEANTTERTVASAKALLSGLLPGCTVGVHVRAAPNPLFSPAAGPPVDAAKLKAAVDGRMGGEPGWFAHAFAAPLAQMYRILQNCTADPCTPSRPDFRTQPVTGGPVSAGADFAENFLLQYTQGFPMQEVGWGRVSRPQLDELMQMNTQYHEFMLRTPYAARVAASDLAAHIRDTLLAAGGEHPVSARLGPANDRFLLLDGHDSNLSWLGGLLRMDWLLPDQTFDATPPGSALVFELRRNKGTGAMTVRVLFISQTLDQMRFLRPLGPAEPPSIAPVFVPGCSTADAGYPCALDAFAHTVSAAIDPALTH